MRLNRAKVYVFRFFCPRGGAFCAFVPEALAIARDGFVFHIKAQNRLIVQGSELLPATSFSFNRDAFAACLLSLSGKHTHYRQLIQTLFVSMDARADSLPPDMLASPNHLGAHQFPDQLATLINDENDMGWISSVRPFPSHLRFICGPTSVVAKPGTDKLRKVNDVAHPRPQSYGSLYGGRSLAPNAHSVIGPEACVEYGSIQDMASDVAILCDLARGSDYPVVGANREYENWYRQTPIAKRDAWACDIAIGGHFYNDGAMRMGATHSAATGQILSSVAVAYFFARLDYECP